MWRASSHTNLSKYPLNKACVHYWSYLLHWSAWKSLNPPVHCAILGRPRPCSGGNTDQRPGIALGEDCSRQREEQSQRAEGSTELSMCWEAGVSISRSTWSCHYLFSHLPLAPHSFQKHFAYILKSYGYLICFWPFILVLHFQILSQHRLVWRWAATYYSLFSF